MALASHSPHSLLAQVGLVSSYLSFLLASIPSLTLCVCFEVLVHSF